MCVFSILVTISVNACRFKLETRKGIEGKYYIMLHDRSRVSDKLLSTYLTVDDPSVLFWNGSFIEIRDKKILEILRNLIIEGSPWDKDYYDKLEQREEQDKALYDYLIKKI